MRLVDDLVRLEKRTVWYRTSTVSSNLFHKVGLAHIEAIAVTKSVSRVAILAKS